MELSKQVVSLELSKRLCELGVKQESLFWWYYQIGGVVVDREVAGVWCLRSDDERGKGFGEYVSAFTVAELGELLPKGCGSWKMFDEKKGFACDDVDVDRQPTILADTEADARAKCLIYSIENNLITP